MFKNIICTTALAMAGVEAIVVNNTEALAVNTTAGMTPVQGSLFLGAAVAGKMILDAGMMEIQQKSGTSTECGAYSKVINNNCAMQNELGTSLLTQCSWDTTNFTGGPFDPMACTQCAKDAGAPEGCADCIQKHTNEIAEYAEHLGQIMSQKMGKKGSPYLRNEIEEPSPEAVEPPSALCQNAYGLYMCGVAITIDEMGTFFQHCNPETLLRELNDYKKKMAMMARESKNMKTGENKK